MFVLILKKDKIYEKFSWIEIDRNRNTRTSVCTKRVKINGLNIEGFRIMIYFICI